MVGLLTPISAPRPKTLTFITSFSRRNKFGQERRSYDQSISLRGCVWLCLEGQIYISYSAPSSPPKGLYFEFSGLTAE